MGRPTLAEQLKKAAAEGDLDKVKEIADKLAAKPQKKVTKPKVTRTKKQKVDIIDPEDLDHCEEGDIIETEESHIFRPNNRSRSRTETYIDKDGVQRTRSRVVPFKVIRNRPNKWEDEITADDLYMQKQREKHFKMLEKKGLVHKVKSRDAEKQIKVECIECHKKIKMWQSDLMVNINRFVCDSCLDPNTRRGK